MKLIEHLRAHLALALTILDLVTWKVRFAWHCSFEVWLAWTQTNCKIGSGLRSSCPGGPKIAHIDHLGCFGGGIVVKTLN